MLLSIDKINFEFDLGHDIEFKNDLIEIIDVKHLIIKFIDILLYVLISLDLMRNEDVNTIKKMINDASNKQ